MKNINTFGILRVLALLICLATVIAFSGCARIPADGAADDGDTPAADNTQDTGNKDDGEGEEDEEKKLTLDYSGIDVDDYVTSVSYKDLKIVMESEEDSREDALWEAILATALIKDFPEDAVNYYFEQTKAYYMYIAENDDECYQLLLESRDITEEDIKDDARELVKKDLVYFYIVEKEQITISDEEKQELFERYVETYVVEYGYNIEYVQANMTEHIYESMLYDKTMELLVLSNTFEVSEEAEQQKPLWS